MTITAKGWTLHYITDGKVGEPVSEGDEAIDFRGDYLLVEGGEPPHKVNSTGRVHTSRGSLFPSVINARWIHEGGGHARD